jgi:hypothetical protein
MFMICTVHVVRWYVIMFLNVISAYLLFSHLCTMACTVYFCECSYGWFFYIVECYKFVLGECMIPPHVCNASKFGLYWKDLHARVKIVCLVVSYLKILQWKCKRRAENEEILVTGRAEVLWLFKCIAAKSHGGEDVVYLGCDTVSLHVQFQTLKKEVVWSCGMWPVMQCHILEEALATMSQELCLTGYS